MGDFTDFDHIKKQVDAMDGILSVTMLDLRDAHKVARLGVHVRNAIHAELAKRGIGHHPEELPEYQHDPVRLYISGSNFADLIESLSDYSPGADQKLRAIFRDDSRDLLQRIRELVCD